METAIRITISLGDAREGIDEATEYINEATN